MSYIPEQQITPEGTEQQFQPIYDVEKTRNLIKYYRGNEHTFSEEDLDKLRNHAYHYNVPFYEGDFSILDAIKQAGGGFIEGFTTLRVSDPPDNEYEAVARSVGHLAGFVPGILSGPLKALGLMNSAKAMAGLKSIPMIGADFITKRAKKIVAPAFKGALNSKFKAADTASKFFMGDKAKHIAEGAFHLGTASAISSVWDGVDTMMDSFVHGGMAGGVFRVIGNVVPGTKTGDKFIKGLAGSLFMGLPATARGATTPEQIYEYLAGAYFGHKEMPWFKAQGVKGYQKFQKESETNNKLRWEKNPEEMEGWEEYPDIVKKEIKDIVKQQEGTVKDNMHRAEYLMKELGIADKIPAEEWTSKGYDALSSYIDGTQKRTKYKAMDKLGVGVSGGGKGADTAWGKAMDKYGFPVIHMIPETTYNKSPMAAYIKGRDTGKIKGIPRGLKEFELMEAGPAVEKANLTLKRPVEKLSREAYDYILRNYFQVKGAKSLYAIGEIETEGPTAGRTVKKGTGWAVQMGIDKGLQDIFVFDSSPHQNTWFQWSAKANRFKAITGTPKLKQNPALIGHRELTPAGRKAIKDVAEVTFGDIKTGEKSKLPIAASPDQIKKLHVKTIENIKNLREVIDTSKKEIKDINEVLKEGKVDKVRKKELLKLKRELEKNINNAYKEIVEVHEPLEATQHVDIHTGEIVQDIDTGMKSLDLPLMQKSEYFSNKYLRDIWDIGEGSFMGKRDHMLQLGKNVETLLRNYIERGNKNIKINELAKDIEKVMSSKGKDFSLSSDAKGNLKKWLRELNLGKQIIYAKVKTRGKKTNIQFTLPERPTSASGMAIRQVEAPKIIEEVYSAEGGKLGKGIDSPIVIFDSISKVKKNGLKVDVPIDKLFYHFKYTEKMKDAQARTAVKNEKARVIQDLIKNHNMYPYGGQGDKGRIIFIKLHPKNRDAKSVQKKWIELVKALRQRKDKNGKRTDVDALTMLQRDAKAMKNTYGISQKDFRKMVISNVMYDLSMNGYKTDMPLKELMDYRFLGNPIAFNKRNQIWMTGGYGGDKEFFKNARNKDDLGNIILNDLSPRDNFLYRLIEDPSIPANLRKQTLKALNNQLPEHVDGAILVRQDVINLINEDAGAPKSGQNKSFIVDNTGWIDPATKKEMNMGALLGKYMMHNAGEEASNAMKKQGIHMMVMTSSAKQLGKRKTGDYDVSANGELTLKGGETYELDPYSIKYNTSVINDSHMLGKQIWVKQLFTNLHKGAFKSIDKTILDDIDIEVIQKKFKGEPVANKALENYIKTFDSSKIDYLLKNIEDIGTNELIKALKTPGAERFAERAMQRMLRIVEKDIEAQFQEGEISAKERASSLKELSESVTPIDRLLKNISIIGEEAMEKGGAGYSGYLHKFVRDYRDSVLKKYFVKSITRPTADNSAVARIRPYDKWMQKDKVMKELNTNDKIFFLDNAYKNTEIKLPDGKKYRLEELWALKDTAKYKNIVNKAFSALVLRVPMDSISGAHKLQFSGFTGREGHGIMLHSRSMRALGGADLDGDEAFIYFGGKNEDGTGHGMKQSWLNAIHANKKEYYTKNGKHITDAKEAWRPLLTTSGTDNPMKSKKSLYYSPLSRLNASEGAYDGRNMLGTAVIQGQVMKSAWNSILESPNKSDSFTIDKGGKRFRITFSPKNGIKSKNTQRALTRAQIAFASDPLDEVGLASQEVFFNTLHNAYFKNTKVEVKNKKTGRFKKIDLLKTAKQTQDYAYTLKHEDKTIHLSPSDLKRGLLGNLYDMNKAYFSRNYEEGRNYTIDEINHLASGIRYMTENQKNTMLPKFVERLDGLDWTDNLFNRVERVKVEDTYREIEEMVKDKDGRFGGWLKKALGRSSFRVAYNDHIQTAVINKLYDKTVRHRIANNDTREGLQEFINVVKHSVFGKEFLIKPNRLRKLYNYDERIKVLEQISRQAEDFLSNDIATMSTLLNVKRILDNNRINPKKIEKISRQIEKFKARSYLSRKERSQLDYDSYLGTPKDRENISLAEHLLEIQDLADGKQIKQKDLIGDRRSASWDQMQLDAKIKEFKKGLNKGEKELFDHLFLGSLQRGNLKQIQKYTDMLAKKKNSPLVRDLITKLIGDAAKTNQTRLAINSEQVSDSAIQNHFRAMNDIHSKMWKEPSENEVTKILNDTNKAIEEVKPSEPDIVDEMVQGALKNQGYAGIKKGEVSKEDKKVLTEIATILKRYNKKIGNNLPDLNEQIRGITAVLDPDMRGQDLNTLGKQDFIRIRNYLREVQDGTMWQKIWKSSSPEIQKRYWTLFPETVNRELMSHDIKWLKTKGWVVGRGGKVTEAYIRKPTYFLDMFQDIIHKNNSIATGKAETQAKRIENVFNNLQELKEGESFFKIAVAQKELGVKKDIDKLEEPDSIKEHFRLTYDLLQRDTEKKHNWSQLKTKEFTVLNDVDKRITATGFDIVNGNKSFNLTGVKQKISKEFEDMHHLITGDSKAFTQYTTGKYFDPETKTQPKMNWKKFVKDMQKALEKGDDIPMELGIDGMRHIMRSMMVDLSKSPVEASKYKSWIIKRTGKIPYERYWPHMFFDKASAEKSIKNAVEFIRKDSTLNPEQRKKAIEKIAIRHKTVTGDWEFQDMQDWDKVDVYEMQEGLKRVAEKKTKRDKTVHWTDMNPTFASMHSRKGHIPGWSTNMNVMQVYGKNLINTYYRQISHLMSRKTLDEAKTRMDRKFGKDLSNKWQRYFKLYIQGAMGQPDVIPERWYEDKDMKLKGTPFAWWADNRVLDRVNSIRKKLGIRESDLPEKLKDFDYQDLRHWSNMEAKFELASLLAHPKTAITNIFGGSLHTIQSAGPGALKKARDIKFLKRINPEWNSLADVGKFVVSKGVVPEFMIHELGLGVGVNKGAVSKFIGDLSSKINSKDPISRKEILSLGKKHGLTDAIVSKASKFMSVPERMLRRDAFMAHYVRAWERFGGAIKDPNHPFLIETAKKGVKATQFLYEAPFRPFFARTALGKIMSRFQLYAWNSARFRNDVIRQAKLYGFKPGTEAYNKFTRTMQIDLFTLALGNMFAYSLFDNALPQPWSWFQDTAEWLFGDEREREKAFFGAYPKAIAPLQIITPPLARFPVSGLMQWARDDYTKFTDYQVYTMFPFGRMIRDVVQPEHGLIDNPSRLLEKVAGMPLRDVQKFSTQRKKDIEEGKRYKQPKVGF